MAECSHSEETDHLAAELFEQLQRFFFEALQRPQQERLPWANGLSDVNEKVRTRLIWMLTADLKFNDDAETADIPAIGLTADLPCTQSESDPARKRPGIPNYELLEEINRGGMGIVYRAQQQRPLRIVAIKMMRMGPFASSLEIQRFLQEANAASALQHPAIVPVYEVGEVCGEPFISMKYIDGETLDQRLISNSLTANEAIQVLLVVSRAIADAHAHSIIHRDLKPSNILVDRKSGQPWVTDFGLARSLTSATELTAAGDIMGTPGYMAPEQALGNSAAIGRATDVYSLGAILYRILTGRPPIQEPSGDMVKTIQLIREHDVLPARERDRRIPRALNILCMKALETDPQQRYPDARMFADDLQRFLDGEMVEARPLGWWRRLRRWARQRPGLASTMCVVTVLTGYHVAARLFRLTPHSSEFSWLVIIVASAAILNASFCQYLLRRTDGAAWTLYAWSTGETLLLTILIFGGDGVHSGLLSAYFLLVAVSLLRRRPLLVVYVTTLAILTITIIWVSAAIFQHQSADPLQMIPRLLSLALLGFIQFIALRQSSASLEIPMDYGSPRRMRNSK